MSPASPGLVVATTYASNMIVKPLYMKMKIKRIDVK